MSKVLNKMCLKPHYSLRSQLFVSFGTTSVLAIGVVMIIATLATKLCGEHMKADARTALQGQVIENLGSSRYLAETISKKLVSLSGVASILAEGTRDRIVGYPNVSDLATDNHVPFRDIDTGRNIYPLSSAPLPADWDIITNINDENFEEHLQERYEWYTGGDISTAHATYMMQGVCDPKEQDSSHKAFYPNCSAANNNFTTGGVVQSTETNKYLYEKAADLSIFLKPLYESHDDVKLIGVFFANSGAGASVVYPGTTVDGTASYPSIGCKWLSEQNPHTEKPLGTDKEISRCHIEDSMVPGREYNPLERGWCMDQALTPDKVLNVGPYPDAFEGNWLLSFGKAIFDRKTGHFLGCTLIDVSITRIEEILENVLVGNDSDIALVRWDDGTVVSSSNWNSSSATETIHIDDLRLGIEFEKDIKSLIDFETPKTSTEIQELFGSKVFEAEGRWISAYPVAVTGFEYDASYPMEFLMILSVKESIFDSVERIYDSVDKDVEGLIVSTLVIGSTGIFVILLLIWIMSIFLTRPLNWMSTVARRIVNNASDEDSTENAVDYYEGEEKPLLRFTPNSEITLLVSEFRFMIRGFSGEGPARAARPIVTEVKNTVAWQHEFGHFYPVGENEQLLNNGAETDVSSSDTLDQIPEDEQAPEKQRQDSKLPARGTCPERVNRGSNLSPSVMDATRHEETKFVFSSLVERHKNALKSPLFWWIIVLIGLPLLLTLAAIGVVVAVSIARELPTWLDDISEESIMLEQNAITSYVRARALFAKEAMAEPVRDLHLLTRVSGWLFFGAINRSDGFTEMLHAAEECKFFGNDTCPFHNDESRTPCDCAWEDSLQNSCTEYPNNFVSRVVQKKSYAGQRHGADPITGSRWNNLFPANAPNETAWWTNATEMPGSYKGSSASGYETTYDRVRVSSALAVVEFPIYNYDRKSRGQKHIGTYVGMEADGMLVGWSGCEYLLADFASFKSTKENGAASIRPDLCPLSTYGYDARCRDWYDQGKKKSKMEGTSGLHITPPYVFAGRRDVVASSATSPLANPSTDEYVGQTIVDFIPEAIVHSLEKDLFFERMSRSFTILITPENDALGGNTVVGPRYSLGSKLPAPALADLILPNDGLDSKNRDEFNRTVLVAMKEGNNSETNFTRTSRNGEQEAFFIVYAPVYARSLLSLDPSNFSRGVAVSKTLVYSVGFAVPKDDLKNVFNDYRDDVENDLNIATVTVVVLIIVVSAISSFIVSYVALSITSTVVILLGVVQNINTRMITDDIPPMTGGSREVNHVYNSFAKLHKVVRFSNTAFFSGNLSRAYKFLDDALLLFRRLNDQKAISIASNNLGNTLLSMYKEKKRAGGCCIIDERCIWHLCRQCYDESIDVASKHYLKVSRSGTDKSKAKHGDQLANRRFNRALFFFLTRNDPCAPEDVEALGYEDLTAAKRLDQEVRDISIRSIPAEIYCVDYFEKAIRRLCGLVEILLEDDVEDVWGVRELIDEAEHELFVAWNTPSPLFKHISRIGRLQQLEDTVIRYELCINNAYEAARIGLRMLIEDDYILERPFAGSSKAVRTLLHKITPSSIPSWDPGTVSDVKDDLATVSNRCKTLLSMDMRRNIFFCIGHNRCKSNDLIDNANKNLMMLYNEKCTSQDVIGLIVCGDTVGTPDFQVGQKGNDMQDDISFFNRLVDTPFQKDSDSSRNGFFPALEYLMKQLANVTEANDSTWIIATAAIGEPDQRQILAIHSLLSDINQANNGIVNLIIIGIEVDLEHVTFYQNFFESAANIYFIDASDSSFEMNEAFERVGALINGLQDDGSFVYGGLTMERF